MTAFLRIATVLAVVALAAYVIADVASRWPA